MPLLAVGLLFIFGHLSHVHLTTLKIHSVSQTPLNFKQRTSLEVVNNSRNEATSLMRILFLFASDGMPAWSMCLLADAGQSGVTWYEKRAGSDRWPGAKWDI